jgi:multidrug efflux system membrane fusion protein
VGPAAAGRGQGGRRPPGIQADRRSRVATEEGGIVVELPVREGQLVKAGDLLARLDARRLELEIMRVDADAAVAQAQVEESAAEQDRAQRDLLLVRTSFEKGAAKPKELHDAEADVAIMTARVVRWEKAVELIGVRKTLLQERLADASITAPYDGVVVARHTDIGQWVSEGDPVVEVVSTASIEVWVNVPERYLALARDVDNDVDVEIEAAGRHYRVLDRRIIPIVDRVGRHFTVIATLDNSEGRLAPGMAATAWIPTGVERNEMTVSVDAILRNDTGAFVYVVRQMGDGPPKAVQAAVSVLFPVGDRMAVRAPQIRPGDMVVVEGNERLHPMQAVDPIDDVESTP